MKNKKSKSIPPFCDASASKSSNQDIGGRHAYRPTCRQTDMQTDRSDQIRSYHTWLGETSIHHRSTNNMVSNYIRILHTSRMIYQWYGTTTVWLYIQYILIKLHQHIHISIWYRINTKLAVRWDLSSPFFPVKNASIYL